MAMSIGFIIVSHNNPAQLTRLLHRLNALYAEPQIVCHHDFGQCSLDGFDIPANVEFVRPHIRTSWGDLSFQLAALAATRVLYRRSEGPDWMVLLSGNDYPVQPAKLLADLFSSGGFDAYLDHRLIDYPRSPDANVKSGRYGFDSADYVPLAYDRYIARRLWVPWYSHERKKPLKVTLAHLRAPLLAHPFTPFSKSFKCYAGATWYSCNRKVARILAEENDLSKSLIKHYRKRLIPDESIPHTILCNRTDLKIGPGLRYVDWTQGGPHPKTLGVEDIPRILASGAGFARKFDLNKGAAVFDAIDAAVDAAAAE